MWASNHDSVKEDAPWDIRDSTSSDDRGRSALQRTQELCQTYGLASPTDVRANQKVLLDALTAFPSVDDERASLVSLKKERKSHKVKWKELLNRYKTSWMILTILLCARKQPMHSSRGGEKLDKPAEAPKVSKKQVQSSKHRISEKSEQLNPKVT